MRVVDSREPGERKARFLALGWEQKALPTGDYAFEESGGGLVLIEHKTVSGLLADLSSRRIVAQAHRLKDATQWPILLVEGSWRHTNGKLLETRWTWDAAWNELESLQDLGLRLQLTTSPGHTVSRVNDLADYYEKPYHPSTERRVAGNLPLAAVCVIPGIDYKRAETLLAAYGDLASLAAASRPQLEAVPGIGPKLALAIYSFFNGGAA